MRISKIFLISFFNLIFATTLLQYFRINNILPNTSIIILVLLVIHFGFQEALIFSLFAAVFNDLFFTMALGPNLLLLPTIALFVAMFDEVFSKVNYLGPVVLTGLATIIYHGIYYVFMYFLRTSIDIKVVFTSILPQELIYNILICVFLYSLTRKRYSDLENI